jgi:putative ABC transport system ATP-binding protein
VNQKSSFEANAAAGDDVALRGTAAAHAQHAEGEHRSPLSRFFLLIRPDRRDLTAIVIFSLVIGLLGLATPIAVEALVNSVAFGGLVQPVVVLAAMLFGCLALANFLVGLQTYLAELIQRRLLVRTLADLAVRVPRVRWEAFDHAHGPELINRFFDVVTLQKVTAAIVLDGIAIGLSTIIGMVVLAFYHPLLLGFDLLLLVSLAILVFLLGRQAVTTSIRESRAKYAVAGWLEALAQHGLAFHLKHGRRLAVARADALAHDYLRARSDHFRVLFRQTVFALVLQVLASSALLGLGGWLVIAGQLTLGQLVAAELIIGVIVGSFAKLGKHFEGFYDLMASVDKLGHLFDLPTEAASGKLASDSRQGMSVRLEKLGFEYDGRAPLFAEFDEDIAPGEQIAVLGAAATGKSTLAELLVGLRRPTSGRIELDGIDLRDWDLEALRGQVFVVRRAELIAGSVEENVVFAGDSPAAGHRALVDVGLLEELQELPDGIQTRLTVGGAPLSSTQRLRLMLARALAARPRLLVIDDVLDVLDETARERAFAEFRLRRNELTVVVLTKSTAVAGQCSRAIAVDH